MLNKKEYYALTNPICRITDKSCEEFTREDLINVIKEKEIERVTFHYTAIDGKIKELRIPIANRPSSRNDTYRRRTS